MTYRKFQRSRFEWDPSVVPRGGTSSVLLSCSSELMEEVMNGIIYIIGLIVVILAILSFFGLR